MQNFGKRIILFSLLLIFIKAKNHPNNNINCNLFTQRNETIFERLNDFFDSIFALLNNCEKQGNLNCEYELHNLLSIKLNQLLNQGNIAQLTRNLYDFYYRNPTNITKFKIFTIKKLTGLPYECSLRFYFFGNSFCISIMELFGFDESYCD